ncbi:hypothetical protein [Novipirellula sp.]|uniref:hypothetical protein n=1 Tax=Novipirellula sp. TaxID=2795430 RepID=UPI003562AFFF
MIRRQPTLNSTAGDAFRAAIQLNLVIGDEAWRREAFDHANHAETMMESHHPG